jgi:hypothetical protein
VEKDIRYVRIAIEDLAFTRRSSRVTIWGYPHIIGDVVLSTTLPKEQGMRASTGTEAGVLEIGCSRAQLRAAEKGGEEWR